MERSPPKFYIAKLCQSVRNLKSQPLIDGRSQNEPNKEIQIYMHSLLYFFPHCEI
jgi:hypothetical protein